MNCEEGELSGGESQQHGRVLTADVCKIVISIAITEPSIARNDMLCM